MAAHIPIGIMIEIPSAVSWPTSWPGKWIFSVSEPMT